MLRHSYRVLLAALLLVASVGCQSDEEKLDAHMSRGDAYLEEEQYAEAIIEYKSALQIDPNHADAHWGLAQAHLKNEQPREGFWELRETARLDPNNIDAKLEFGQLSIFAGELEQALQQAEEVIAVEPARVRAHVLKGMAFEALKKPEEARAAYEKAMEMGGDDEDLPAALALLANFHNRRGDRETAEPYYRKLTEVKPSFRTYLNLGGFLVQARTRDDEAEAAYRKALELADPDLKTRAYGTLAGFYFSRNRFDESVETLEAGIEDVEDPLDLIYLLARFYGMKGHTEKADDLFEQATRERPDDPRAFLVLSTYRGRRNDMLGALEAAERALEIDPENQDAKLRRAELVVDLGYREQQPERVDEGRALIDEILAQNPTNPGALVVKAKIDLAQNQVKDAVTALHAALDSRPDWAEAHFLLGSALAVQGDRTASRTELARALEIDAGLVEARKVLAQVHHALGEHEYAVEEARRFLAERPADTSLRIVLAQSLVNLGKRREGLLELEAIPEAEREPRVRYALGQVHLSLEQYAEARKQLERAHRDMPENADILRGLLALDRRDQRVGESVERIDAAVAANPDDGRLQQLKGMVHLMSGNVDEAEQSLKKAIELAPDDLSGYQRLASFYVSTRRAEQAIDTYQKAVEVQPERAQLHYMLGVLRELTGDRPTAIGRYEEAIRLSPELAEAKNNLAYLYADSGENLDRALDLAQEAKALLPDSAHAADTLGWVLYKRGIPSAAISFLKEAETGTLQSPAEVGLVRHHLALAYEANDEPEQARQTAQRALEDLDRLIADARSRDQQVGEPAWAAAMRAMLQRLEAREG